MYLAHIAISPMNQSATSQRGTVRSQAHATPAGPMRTHVSQVVVEQGCARRIKCDLHLRSRSLSSLSLSDRATLSCSCSPRSARAHVSATVRRASRRAHARSERTHTTQLSNHLAAARLVLTPRTLRLTPRAAMTTFKSISRFRPAGSSSPLALSALAFCRVA
jgi:hypothetical protein